MVNEYTLIWQKVIALKLIEFLKNSTMWYNYMVEYKILLYNEKIKWHECCKIVNILNFFYKFIIENSHLFEIT